VGSRAALCIRESVGGGRGGSFSRNRELVAGCGSTKKKKCFGCFPQTCNPDDQFWKRFREKGRGFWGGREGVGSNDGRQKKVPKNESDFKQTTS